MIRIMILDDDEMYLKKEKDITEQYFAEKNVDCTVTIYQNVCKFCSNGTPILKSAVHSF